MKYPHVTELRYGLDNKSTSQFVHPSPREYDAPRFTLRLDNDKLCVTMKDDSIPDEDEALAFVAPFLRAWAIDHSLRSYYPPLSFIPEGATIAESVGPDGAPRLRRTVRGQRTFLWNVEKGVPSTKYPDPPTGFRVDPTVETLFTRFRG